jgi:hypothetical protein
MKFSMTEARSWESPIANRLERADQAMEVQAKDEYAKNGIF